MYLKFKGDPVLIPLGLQNYIKWAFYSSHIGIDKCLRLTSECVFWSGISSDLRFHFYMGDLLWVYDRTA